MKTRIANLQRNEIDEILFQALRSVYQFERSKVAQFGLTYEGIYLLQYLRRKSPAKMGDIAEEMKIPVSTATRVVDRLQKKNLLSRCKDPNDKRNILVSLEDAGDKIVQDVEEHTFRVLTQNLMDFNEDDINGFIHTAAQLSRILNE